MLQRTTLLIIAVGFSLSLTGCIKPYQIPIQQGNIITATDASKIHNGMTPNQVIAALGQPILDNLYDNDLVYVYTYLPSHNKPTVKKKLIVTFRNNHAVKIEHD